MEIRSYFLMIDIPGNITVNIDTNGKPQTDKVNHLAKVYELGKRFIDKTVYKFDGGNAK